MRRNCPTGQHRGSVAPGDDKCPSPDHQSFHAPTTPTTKRDETGHPTATRNIAWYGNPDPTGSFHIELGLAIQVPPQTGMTRPHPCIDAPGIADHFPADILISCSPTTETCVFPVAAQAKVMLTFISRSPTNKPRANANIQFSRTLRVVFIIMG